MEKILIVDDEADFRKTLRRVFEKAKYEVIEASNGEEAIKYYDENFPDLVIIDVFMPKFVSRNRSHFSSCYQSPRAGINPVRG